MGIFDRIDRIAEQLGDLIVPDDVRAHDELGAAYLDRGDLDAAVTELTRAVALRPDHPRALYLLGVAYARRGDESEAIGALERAATARRVGVDRPGFPEAWLALADVHRRRGDDDGAVDAYRAALDAGVGDSAMRAEIYRGLGSVYLRQRRYDKAVRELRKAVAATPDDTETQGLLGRALYLKGDYETARVCLERAAQAARPDPLGLASLGDLFERLGRVSEARDAYERALAAPDSDGGEVQTAARLGLARLALAGGDAETARTEALRALERDPSRPDILLTLGRVYASAQQWDDALAAYDRALVVAASGGGQRGQLMLFDRPGLLEEALRAALRAGATARANNYATALLADAPEHHDALAATARAAADGGELERAQTLVERALAANDTVEARLAAADVALKRGQPTHAAAALRRAAELAPDDPRPRARLGDVYREAAPAAPAHELYALLSQAHRLFARTRELAELSPDASRLVEVLDRPLLVTVMGEFNSGKSTFVNALIGEEVAPMGITPTTATINVLKYGTERKGRVVYHDDEVREVAWNDVPKLLKGLDAAEAKRIRVVEVLYPLEVLQRVNVVDTPGLNSIHPEHEATARQFIAEADAVLWLFTVDQAAKATEGEALGKIKAAGKKILGVVNKIDRCSPEELQRIIDHVRGALGEHLETIVPFAARQALLARKATPADGAQLAASNYPALASALEERFFSRARAIKREAATTRLRQLLAQARAVGQAALDRRALEPIASADATLRAEQLAFERDFIVAERRRLNEAADAVYAACAREVLDFVRPRRWAFGSNEAAPADRDFLIQLLDERLGALLDASRARAQAEAERAIAVVRAVDAPDASFDAEMSLLGEQVFGRFRAFARGYLRGGRVDDFFTRVLPKLELTEAQIQRALERDAPWSDDVAEAELRAPLRRWAEQFYGGLNARLRRLRTGVELDRLEIEERLIAPVEQIAIALDSLS